MKKPNLWPLILLVALVGCQSAPKAAEPAVTAKPAPAPAPASEPAAQPADPLDENSIVAGNTGFSPLAQSPANLLSFSLHFARPDAAQGWSVDFADEAGTLVRSIKGVAPQLPPTLTWDGNSDAGRLAHDGNYRARLTVDYGKGGTLTAESETFLLDITPASGTISVTPQPWEPGDPDLMVNPPEVTLSVALVPGAAPVSSWRLAVFHPDGRRFMDFISEDHRDNVVRWTGRALNNAGLERGITYDLVAQVFDRYGNVGTLKGALVVAKAVAVAQVAPPPQPQPAPVTVSVDGKLIASTQIFFPAYSADLTKVDGDKKAANDQALDALAQTLKAAGSAKIRVIGHANKFYWWDAKKGEIEQEAVLIPLSKARAEAVRDALVLRGLQASTFELTGVGAEGALAPFRDTENNWKNRRVEFVLGLETIR
jgi:outer membrane protein OmpA-like peptidoglycan-associated protein